MVNRYTLFAIAVSILLFAPNSTTAQIGPPAGIPTTNAAPIPAPTAPLPPGLTRIFDGKSLAGWVQAPPYSTTFSGGDINDVAGFWVKISNKSDPVAAFVAEQFDSASRASLTTMPSDKPTRDHRTALARGLNGIINGPSIYTDERFKAVNLREQSKLLASTSPQGGDLARLNRMLLEDAFPADLGRSVATAWFVRDGILSSSGAGRGVIYTSKSYDRYRVIFDARHVWGSPDHRAGVLVFCTEPTVGEKPLDALGGIQFQVPNGGSWDYRKGKNNSGKDVFTRLVNPRYDEHEWSRVEILVDPTRGIARMAVAQPVGATAVEVLVFNDPTAGQKGPFALQIHNKGLFDEYANIAIEENPTVNDLITVKK
jgi:hypothetical protein